MKKSRSPRSNLEVVYERRNGSIVAFQVRGHSGFVPTGRDIVCAAVSALVLSAAHGLQRHCGMNPQISDRSSTFRLELSSDNTRAQAVLATMVSGLEAIAASHPGYLRIKQGRLIATGPSRLHAKSKSPRAWKKRT